jgi:hypothetical protein
MVIPGAVFGDIQQVARSGKQLGVRRARAEARVDQFESDLARAVAQIDKDEIRARLIAMLSSPKALVRFHAIRMSVPTAPQWLRLLSEPRKSSGNREVRTRTHTPRATPMRVDTIARQNAAAPAFFAWWNRRDISSPRPPRTIPPTRNRPPATYASRSRERAYLMETSSFRVPVSALDEIVRRELRRMSDD